VADALIYGVDLATRPACPPRYVRHGRILAPIAAGMSPAAGAAVESNINSPPRGGCASEARSSWSFRDAGKVAAGLRPAAVLRWDLVGARVAPRSRDAGRGEARLVVAERRPFGLMRLRSPLDIPPYRDITRSWAPLPRSIRPPTSGTHSRTQ